MTEAREPDAPRHLGTGRPGEATCACPHCGCATVIAAGERLCEGCLPLDDGEPATDHVPCADGCPAPAPHVLRTGAIAPEPAG